MDVMRSVGKTSSQAGSSSNMGTRSRITGAATALPQQAKALERLQILTEKALIDRILLPLLSKLDFESTELRQGVYEKGVDILCLKKDELEQLDVVAIQVKKLKFSGAATKQGHLHGVLNQLSQCAEEPIKLKDGTERYANRIWLVSPYQLDIAALEASFDKYARTYAKRITIIDGSMLLSLIHRKAPELLSELGNPLASYMEALEAQIALMREASALRINQPISLLPIYINLDLSLLPTRAASILNEPVMSSQTTPVCLKTNWESVEYWIRFNEAVHAILGVTPLGSVVVCAADGKTGTQDYLEPERFRIVHKPETGTPVHMRTTLDDCMFRRALRDVTRRRTASLKQALGKSSNAARTALLEFRSYSTQLGTVLAHMAAVGIFKPSSGTEDAPPDEYRVNIDADQLLESGLNYQVIGAAGSGKTTLLRILAHSELVRRTGRIPVLVPLASMTPQHTVLGIAYQSSTAFGYPGSRDSFTRLLRDGKAILLLAGC